MLPYCIACSLTLPTMCRGGAQVAAQSTSVIATATFQIEDEQSQLYLYDVDAELAFSNQMAGRISLCYQMPAHYGTLAGACKNTVCLCPVLALAGNSMHSCQMCESETLGNASSTGYAADLPQSMSKSCLTFCGVVCTGQYTPKVLFLFLRLTGHSFRDEGSQDMTASCGKLCA